MSDTTDPEKGPDKTDPRKGPLLLNGALTKARFDSNLMHQRSPRLRLTRVLVLQRDRRVSIPLPRDMQTPAENSVNSAVNPAHEPII